MQRYSIPKDIARHLIKTYGERAYDIAKSFERNPQTKQRLHSEYPYTEAELRYSIKNEMSVNPDDFLFRRTRMGFLDGQAVIDCLPQVVELYRQENGWDNDKAKQVYKESHQKI